MICPECKTEYGYFRMNKDEWVCRKCGKVTKKKDKMNDYDPHYLEKLNQKSVDEMVRGK